VHANDITEISEATILFKSVSLQSTRSQLLLGKADCTPVSEGQQILMEGQFNSLPLFGGWRQSATETLDRAFSNVCRLTIVATTLTEAVWPQFAKQVFGAQSVLQFGKNRKGKLQGVRFANLVLQGSRQATLFSCSDSFPVRRTG